MKRGTIGIILGAAKVRDELVPVFGAIPSTLIPINGRPAVFFILEHFKSIGIKKVYISTGYKEQKVARLLEAYGKEKEFVIQPIRIDSTKRPGTALIEILKKMPKDERERNGIYVHLADTLPVQKVIPLLSEDFVVVSKEYQGSEKWCVVDTSPKNNMVVSIYDKQPYMEGKQALVGVYNITTPALFTKLPKGNYEISYLLAILLKKNIPIKAIPIKGWLDLGHVGKYYQAKRRLLQTRNFNKLTSDSRANTIVKRSSRGDILKKEINWYLHIPKELSIYAPRVIDHNVRDTKNMFAELEFYGYPSLSELWLYSGLSVSIWQTILDRVFSILNQFRTYTRSVPMSDYVAMYEKKTLDRVAQARASNKVLKDLLDAPVVIVNKQKLHGWVYFEKKLHTFAKQLYDTADNSFLHGDFCFSNILFDLNHGVVKLVDPRGEWGSQSFYGDCKYDVAKLRHSVSGMYDHIVQGHTQLEFTPARIGNTQVPTLTITFPLATKLNAEMATYLDQQIMEYWDLNQIKLIEALLFVSMIPLHGDNQKRQIAMFARGIVLLNELEASGTL